MPTYYEVLGLPRRATAEEIRTAYLEKSNETYQNHACFSEKGLEEIAEIRKAWIVLGKGGRKDRYDVLLNAEETKKTIEAKKAKAEAAQKVTQPVMRLVLTADRQSPLKQVQRKKSVDLLFESIAGASPPVPEQNVWMTRNEALSALKKALWTHERRHIDILSYSASAAICSDLSLVARVHSRNARLRDLVEELQILADWDWCDDPTTRKIIHQVRWEVFAVENAEAAWA
ncbi:hypothetical protein NKR23_g10328 [Pleurostoma richardsiae]|uniref:J domain-containing protein n=1 Tax=Pleurostoma richardsiae TaxID=41990 RepID=A0AA38RAF4_9PEZI|nr:hypothetical protein NKR23_g10328 [Pleurostoma richardsiae]